MKKMKKRGWIEVICGPMFSGKTEELIRRVKRAKIAKQGVQVFKHGIDVRYDKEKVISHDGLNVEANPIKESEQIKTFLKPDTEVVAIDEAQFFDENLLLICNQLADEGLRVIVAGLDTDFRGEPFGPMPNISAIADKVDKLTAICVKCGAPATRSQRLINGRPASYIDPLIIVGAKEMYEARCRHCYRPPRKRKARKIKKMANH